MKSFKGTLETLDGARAQAIVVIDEVALTIESSGERLGSWEFDAVEVRRRTGDVFDLTIDGEHLMFIAANPIDFAYTVPSWVETHQPKRRRQLRKRLEQGKANLVTRLEQSGGRRRTRKPARSTQHEHRWSEQRLPGGLIRRVCVECDHVSIDLRDTDAPERVSGESEAPTTA